jgi:RNA polymerase sigma factor (sigma-70 family)
MMQIVENCISAVLPLVKTKVRIDDVPDVLADIRLSLWASLPSYRGEARLETYAYVIARRRIVDYYRKQNRQKKSIEAAKQIEPPTEDIMASDYVWLSRREKEILRLVGTCKRNDEISRILFISPHTVRSHVKRINHKLACRSRLELILFAWKIYGGGRT